MESKLLGQSFPSILNQNAAKFATPKSRFTQRTTLKVVGSNFGANVSPSLRVSSPSSAIRFSKKQRMDESETLTLKNIRHSLIRQEDSIICSLLERSQYRYNQDTYDKHAFSMEGFHGCLVEYMVRETEKLHAQVGRYNSPDEHPFYPQHLPEPMLPPLQYPKVLHPCADSININDMILTVYFGDILPRLVQMGDDGNYGSTAVCDTICLQDSSRLMELLTYETVEAAVKKRVAMKTKAYAQELNQTDDTADADPVYKIQPNLVGYLYDNWIMPLTKKVQVEYLLRRLD
ncbi:hypothetical protein QQP08_006045 [Theobroma cacao]|nr:hypothetical protein QQP08_006045 [Theobroma cacao]